MGQHPTGVVAILNGPNLGRLGRRQPEIYGTTTLADLERRCLQWARAAGLTARFAQTDHEGEMVGWLNRAADDGAAVVLNAAAWTHYSYALADACAQLTGPLIEVHLSDPTARPEAWRHTSVITAYAARVIAGHGIEGYRMAIDEVARLLD